jgi:hypothetical protein
VPPSEVIGKPPL